MDIDLELAHLSHHAHAYHARAIYQKIKHLEGKNLTTDNPWIVTGDHYQYINKMYTMACMLAKIQTPTRRALAVYKEISRRCSSAMNKGIIP